jgi:hypothetical protein
MGLPRHHTKRWRMGSVIEIKPKVEDNMRRVCGSWNWGMGGP